MLNALILVHVPVTLPPLNSITGYQVFILLGPVVRTPVSANLGLNFNRSSFFLLSTALFRIIFSFLFRVSNHQFVGKGNYTEFAF